VAIGLSAGFLEPLESTSIHLIQSGLVKFLDLWPGRTIDPLLSEQYNRAMANQYETIRDFIILHYKATARDDTPFWTYCRNMDVPDSLTWKMQHFRASSRIVLTPGELFQPTSWLAVMLGQDIIPEAYDPLADIVSDDAVAAHFERLREAVAGTIETMPTMAAMLQGMA